MAATSCISIINSGANLLPNYSKEPIKTTRTSHCSPKLNGSSINITEHAVLKKEWSAENRGAVFHSVKSKGSWRLILLQLTCWWEQSDWPIEMPSAMAFKSEAKQTLKSKCYIKNRSLICFSGSLHLFTWSTMWRRQTVGARFKHGGPLIKQCKCQNFQTSKRLDSQ